MTGNYHPQGNQILRNDTCQKYYKELEQVENILIIHLIVGENKENKGEKESLSKNQTLPLQPPGTGKTKNPVRIFHMHPKLQ